MKIIFIKRHDEDGDIKTGLLRYSDILIDSVAKWDRSYHVHKAELSKKRGYLRFLKDNLLSLVFLLGNNNKDTIWHATDEMGGWFFPLVKGKKVITYHHVATIEERGLPFYLIWKFATTLAVRGSDTIIAISEETGKELSQKFAVSENKLKVIPTKPGAVFSPKNLVREKKVCCVGELVQRKNISQSIMVFNELIKKPGCEDCKLVICGNGIEKENLIRLVESLHIGDSVSFVQNLGEDEMISLYCSSKALLNTSLYEGFGMVTMEAQSCGTPVLYLEGTNNPKTVVEASIPCTSTEDMAEKLSKIIIDSQEFEKHSKKSLEYWSDKGDVFDRDLKHVYEELGYST